MKVTYITSATEGLTQARISIRTTNQHNWSTVVAKFPQNK